ncbi:signal peptidase I [Actinospica robiniae]|uniref:signal peptidase I n=1 Tax=Actinospica robiniae TaxID=304901 RepID=UPI00042815ED|nr:signal peptidase I [Actinospica robiniae]
MILISLAAGVAVVIACAAVVRRRLLVVVVDGASMAPALEPGERVLVRRRTAGVSVGDIVVFHLPGRAADGQARLIKRVTAVPGDAVPASVRRVVGASEQDRVPAHRLVVIGDGPGSVDSRTWGYLQSSHVIGVVLRSLAPKG